MASIACESAPLCGVPSVLDADHAPDDVAAWAVAHGPSGAAMAPLLAAVRTGRLSAAGRVDALAALERARAMLDAVQLGLIAQIGELDPDGKDWAREDIAAALRVSPLSAANRLSFARGLARFAHTRKLLDAGAITVMHARVLVDAAAQLDDERAALVESRVLSRAHAQTVGEFAKSVKRAVLKVDSSSAEARHEMACKDRRVAFHPIADGMSELNWLLPTDQAAAVKVCMDTAAAAGTHPADGRTSDQRRSDALFALITSADAARARDTRVHGMRPAVQVTASLATLAGASEEPGELAGFGPIPAFLARRIAADPTGTWRRLVTDERGRLLDYGRRTYRPPADLAHFVIARDRTCCFPGCPRAAARCELDHHHDWNDGGGTGPHNLYALCPRHHHLKHEAGWRYEPLPDGDLRWTSPTGHSYRTPAPAYPTESDHDPPPF